MNRYPDRRSLAAVDRAQRPQPAETAVPATGPQVRPEAIPPSDEAAVAFLADILLDERDWTLAEVRSLIALREATGRSGEDAPPTSAGGGLAS